MFSINMDDYKKNTFSLRKHWLEKNRFVVGLSKLRKSIGNEQ